MSLYGYGSAYQPGMNQGMAQNKGPFSPAFGDLQARSRKAAAPNVNAQYGQALGALNAPEMGSEFLSQDPYKVDFIVDPNATRFGSQTLRDPNTDIARLGSNFMSAVDMQKLNGTWKPPGERFGGRRPGHNMNPETGLFDANKFVGGQTSPEAMQKAIQNLYDLRAYGATDPDDQMRKPFNFNDDQFANLLQSLRTNYSDFLTTRRAGGHFGFSGGMSFDPMGGY